MEKQEFSVLDSALSKCDEIDIGVKLRRAADVAHASQKQELKIKTFLTAKHHHNNYKDIRNDVKAVNDMIEEAERKDIALDSNLVSEVNAFTSRLVSERNLRKQRELNIESISSCDQKMVDKLQGLIDDATTKAVEDEYIGAASKLTG